MAVPKDSAVRVLDSSKAHSFEVPVKKINEGPDLTTFLTSTAYRDLVGLLVQLNHAVVPLLETQSDQKPPQIVTFPINSSPVSFSTPVIQLQRLLQTLHNIVAEVPPDEGPRRFGNISFRKWYALVEERALALLSEHLPPEVSSFPFSGDVDALSELQAYYLGSFGSTQRLDYGTGHELSFLAFLGGIWKLGGFGPAPVEHGAREREIVLGVIQP